MTSDEPRTLRLEKLLVTLSDEELDRFCFHHFRDVYEQFARGLSRGEKAFRLVAHCDRRSLLDNLERLATHAAAPTTPTAAVSLLAQMPTDALPKPAPFPPVLHASDYGPTPPCRRSVMTAIRSATVFLSRYWWLAVLVAVVLIGGRALLIGAIGSGWGTSSTLPFPITTEDWRSELERLGTELTRTGDHYWRYVPGGTYTIGGWTDDENNDNDEQADLMLQS
ncbi:MAG: hypothetical protein HC884_18315 [Chloroflexaceae bacterium]|nr:hypothetical protein [Chloroflexaceae bacterium]